MKTEQPKTLSWQEFRNRLIAAGWTPDQADDEILRIQEECEEEG